MANKKVFVSYDYDKDHHLKATLIGQSKQPDCPFSIIDFSLEETGPENGWISKAQSAIAKCEVFVVLLGANTHNASGVKWEVKIAQGLNKERFQLRPQSKNWSKIHGAGDLVVWTQKNLFKRFT